MFFISRAGRKLLLSGLHGNAKTVDGVTAIHLASEFGDEEPRLEILKLLLVNEDDVKGATSH